MRPFPAVLLAVQGHGDSYDSGSHRCLPVPILVGCWFQAWSIRPCQAGNCGVSTSHSSWSLPVPGGLCR